jgi:hypothetical protein
MIDNPMLNWSDPPEWEMIEEDFCTVCQHFAEMCDCSEQAQIGKVDAVLCPDCRLTVLDTQEAIDEHVNDCDGYDYEPYSEY